MNIIPIIYDAIFTVPSGLAINIEPIIAKITDVIRELQPVFLRTSYF